MTYNDNDIVNIDIKYRDSVKKLKRLLDRSIVDGCLRKQIPVKYNSHSVRYRAQWKCNGATFIYLQI